MKLCRKILLLLALLGSSAMAWNIYEPKDETVNGIHVFSSNDVNRLVAKHLTNQVQKRARGVYCAPLTSYAIVDIGDKNSSSFDINHTIVQYWGFETRRQFSGKLTPPSVQVEYFLRPTSINYDLVHETGHKVFKHKLGLSSSLLAVFQAQPAPWLNEAFAIAFETKQERSVRLQQFKEFRDHDKLLSLKSLVSMRNPAKVADDQFDEYEAELAYISNSSQSLKRRTQRGKSIRWRRSELAGLFYAQSYALLRFANIKNAAPCLLPAAKVKILQSDLSGLRYLFEATSEQSLAEIEDSFLKWNLNINFLAEVEGKDE